jgi:hypothetical protein
MWKRRLDLWLPSYLAGSLSRSRARTRRKGKTTHLIMLVCDHYEPRHRAETEQQPFDRVNAWKEHYPRLQRKCLDAFGTKPVHTFFYPPHHGLEHLPALAEMVYRGIGEVELHYHHHGDTAETLRADLQKTIADYGKWGLLLESGERPKVRFGFVHGDWALDNSGHGKYCGVNGELSILQSLGCWGDFTMPSANECQTRKINSIYYAIDDPGRSKSHDHGTDASVGAINPKGFFLMQGPLAINWQAPGHPRIENASLTSENWGRLDRIRTWLDCNVHVSGRPEWIFLKLHTHGAIEKDFDALFGEKAFEMHRLLNEHYNDGQQYKLHYVTARQAYNIARAAENGKEGDPSQWLDFEIDKPVNAHYCLNAQHRVDQSSAGRVVLSEIESTQTTVFQAAGGPAKSIRGALRGIDIDQDARAIRLQASSEQLTVDIELRQGFALQGLEKATLVGERTSAEPGIVRVTLRGSSVISYTA